MESVKIKFGNDDITSYIGAVFVAALPDGTITQYDETTGEIFFIIRGRSFKLVLQEVV